jgi:hypothetical protein
VQFWNSFGTKSVVEAAMDLQETLNLNGLNGGRDRTRTCDLLRVKHYVTLLYIDGTATYKHIFDVIIV